jgi:hypothetical protein
MGHNVTQESFPMPSAQPSPFDAMMSFGKFVPGFEFLQGLVNNAEKTLPNIGQWVAPTLDPAELEKRINDLKAVQFWLEQNGRMLATTIQALEVQKMTLTTLKTMNVSLSDLQSAVMSTPPAPPKAAPAPAPAARPAPAAEPEPEPAKPARKKAAAEAPSAAAQPAVDAMEWWGALTKQFSHLANAAVTDTFKGPGGRNAPPAAPAAAAAKPARGPAPAAPRKAAAKTPRKKT